MQDTTPTLPASNIDKLDSNVGSVLQPTNNGVPVLVPSVQTPLTQFGEKKKGKRIKNKWYVEFLEKGSIQYIKPEHIDQVTANFKGKNRDMSLSLVYCLFLTGARPIEVLNIKAKDVVRDSQYLRIQVSAAKNGLPRPIFIKFSNKYAKHIYEYARQLMPEMYIHYAYRGKYVRHVINKKGVVKTYAELSRPVRSNFAKWFTGILGDETVLPYHLRHNRFSQMSERGATAEEMRISKGARTYASVMPYIHLSSERGKKISKFID